MHIRVWVTWLISPTYRGVLESKSEAHWFGFFLFSVYHFLWLWGVNAELAFFFFFFCFPFFFFWWLWGVNWLMKIENYQNLNALKCFFPPALPLSPHNVHSYWTALGNGKVHPHSAHSFSQDCSSGIMVSLNSGVGCIMIDFPMSIGGWPFPSITVILSPLPVIGLGQTRAIWSSPICLRLLRP